jgi:heme/copper-type cytochrome/quinol oxidase subunit 3
LLPVLPEGFNGIVLGLSVASVLLALRALPRSTSQARGHLFRAFGLGLLFSAYQIVLGWKLLGAGVTLTSSVFGGCLYLMLGSHLLQAILGSLWLGKLVFGMGKESEAAAGALKALAVLWCFLFAIWPLIYVELFF